MAFKQANSFRTSNRGVGDIHRIVFHTAEIHEHPDSAEKIAAFFSNPTTTVSAHVVVDNNSSVTCVRDKDIAYHAFGDNTNTLGIEMAGFAGQSKSQWNDAYSKAELNRAATWAASKAKTYGIPVRWLTEAELRRKEKGFVTHQLVSKVFGENIRSDPGANFPYDDFLALVKQKMQPPVTHWEIQYRNDQGAWAFAKTKRPANWLLTHPGAKKRGAIYIRPRREG